MEMKIRVTKQVNARFIAVDAEVRYWEDSTVNGKVDTCLYDVKGAGSPNMPCAKQVKEEPESCIYSDHWHWQPVIDIDSGQIVNWKAGTTAGIHYKVCDGFACDLLAENNEVIMSCEGYVPDFMCPGEEGFGDYIIMLVDAAGFIRGWDKYLVKKRFEDYE